MAETRSSGEQGMLVFITYVLHLLGAVTGIASLIALVLNYLKRDAPHPLDTHHAWMIRTFWWAALWLVLGWFMVALIVLSPLGLLVGGLAWLWYIYRHVRGIIVLLDDRAMPT